MSDLLASLQINASLPGMVPAVPLRAAPVTYPGSVAPAVDFGAALVGLLKPVVSAEGDGERQISATSGKDLPPEEPVAPDPVIAWLPVDTSPLPQVPAQPPAEASAPSPELAQPLAAPPDAPNQLPAASPAPATATAAEPATPPAVAKVPLRVDEPAPQPTRTSVKPAGPAPDAQPAVPTPHAEAAVRPTAAQPVGVSRANLSLPEARTDEAPRQDRAAPSAPPALPQSPNATPETLVPAHVLPPVAASALIPPPAATVGVMRATGPAALDVPLTIELASSTASQPVGTAQPAPAPVPLPFVVEAPREAADPAVVQIVEIAPAGDDVAPAPIGPEDMPVARERFDLPRDGARPVTPPAFVTLQPPASAPVPITTGAAAQVFAAALTSVADTAPSERVSDAAILLSGVTQTEQRQTVQAMSGTSQAPLDLTRDDWTGQMIERIVALRDSAEATETRIKLAPENLGALEVSIRRDGDRIHVHFAAETPAARQLIADAAPRLAELADARGVKLGQTSVDGGGSQPGGHRDAQQQQPRATARNASAAAELEPITDQRIA